MKNEIKRKRMKRAVPTPINFSHAEIGAVRVAINKKKIMTRAISLLTMGFFLVSQIAYTNPGAGIEVAAHREMPGFLRIDIPSELATLDGLYEAPPRQDPKLILHIQNAHANYGAQQKIKELLQYLEKHYAMKTIFVEGASEDLNPDYLKMFPDRGRNLKLAEFLAKQGELTGAELYLLEADKDQRPQTGDRSQIVDSKLQSPVSSLKSGPVRAVGIEDAGLYRENYEALKKVFGSEVTVKRYLEGFEGSLSTLASKVFSKDLLKLLGEWKKFEKGYREFMPYVKSLAVESKKVLGIDLESLLSQIEWPQITRLLVLQTMEKELDVQKGLAERDQLIAFLKEKRVSQKLITAIENFRDQQVTVLQGTQGGLTAPVQARDLMEQLATEAGPKGFYFYNYPQFSLYAGSLILKSEMDPKGLFGEIRILFTRILDQLAVSQREKKLLELYRNEELVRKLLNLELTRKDWQEVLAKKDLLAMDPLVAELTKIGIAVGREFNLPLSNFETKPVNPQFRKEVTEVQEAAYRFYEAARKREDVFYEKIDSVMRKESLSKAVLITGGFHTDGITELLREHEVSYGILTPRLSEKSDENLYRNVMLQNKPRLFEVSYLENASRETSLRTLENQGMVKADIVASMLGAAMSADGRAEVRDILPAVNASPFAARNEIRLSDTGETNSKGHPIIRVEDISDTRPGLESGGGSGVTPGVVSAVTPGLSGVLATRDEIRDVLAGIVGNQMPGQPDQRTLGVAAKFNEMGLRAEQRVATKEVGTTPGLLTDAAVRAEVRQLAEETGQSPAQLAATIAQEMRALSSTRSEIPVVQPATLARSESRDGIKKTLLAGLAAASLFAGAQQTLAGQETSRAVQSARPAVSKNAGSMSFERLWSSFQRQGVLRGVSQADLRQSIEFSSRPKMVTIVQRAYDLMIKKGVLPRGTSFPVIFLSGISKEHLAEIGATPESFAIAPRGSGAVIVSREVLDAIPDAGDLRVLWVTVKIAHEARHHVDFEKNPGMPVLESEANAYDVTAVAMKLADYPEEQVKLQEKVAAAFRILANNSEAVTPAFGGGADFKSINYGNILVDETDFVRIELTFGGGTQMFGVDLKAPKEKQVLQLQRKEEPEKIEDRSKSRSEVRAADDSKNPLEGEHRLPEERQGDQPGQAGTAEHTPEVRSGPSDRRSASQSWPAALSDAEIREVNGIFRGGRKGVMGRGYFLSAMTTEDELAQLRSRVSSGKGGRNILEWWLERVDSVFEQARSMNPDLKEKDFSILEVGSGDGLLARQLASRGYRVTGMDFMAEFVESANRSNPYPGNLQFVQGDATNLDGYEGYTGIPDNSVDLIISNEWLGNVPIFEAQAREKAERDHREVRPVFEEFFRKLRPGGLYIMNEYDESKGPDGVGLTTQNNLGYINYSIADRRAALQAAGFQDIQEKRIRTALPENARASFTLALIAVKPALIAPKPEALATPPKVSGTRPGLEFPGTPVKQPPASFLEISAGASVTQPSGKRSEMRGIERSGRPKPVTSGIWGYSSHYPSNIPVKGFSRFKKGLLIGSALGVLAVATGVSVHVFRMTPSADIAPPAIVSVTRPDAVEVPKAPDALHHEALTEDLTAIDTAGISDPGLGRIVKHFLDTLLFLRDSERILYPGASVEELADRIRFLAFAAVVQAYRENSQFASFQRGGGPAAGIFQMEPQTAADVLRWALNSPAGGPVRLLIGRYPAVVGTLSEIIPKNRQSKILNKEQAKIIRKFIASDETLQRLLWRLFLLSRMEPMLEDLEGWFKKEVRIYNTPYEGQTAWPRNAGEPAPINYGKATNLRTTAVKVFMDHLVARPMSEALGNGSLEGTFERARVDLYQADNVNALLTNALAKTKEVEKMLDRIKLEMGKKSHNGKKLLGYRNLIDSKLKTLAAVGRYHTSAERAKERVKKHKPQEYTQEEWERITQEASKAVFALQNTIERLTGELERWRAAVDSALSSVQRAGTKPAPLKKPGIPVVPATPLANKRSEIRTPDTRPGLEFPGTPVKQSLAAESAKSSPASFLGISAGASVAQPSGKRSEMREGEGLRSELKGLMDRILRRAQSESTMFSEHGHRRNAAGYRRFVEELARDYRIELIEGPLGWLDFNRVLFRAYPLVAPAILQEIREKRFLPLIHTILSGVFLPITHLAQFTPSFTGKPEFDRDSEMKKISYSKKGKVYLAALPISFLTFLSFYILTGSTLPSFVELWGRSVMFYLLCQMVALWLTEGHELSHVLQSLLIAASNRATGRQVTDREADSYYSFGRAQQFVDGQNLGNAAPSYAQFERIVRDVFQAMEEMLKKRESLGEALSNPRSEIRTPDTRPGLELGGEPATPPVDKRSEMREQEGTGGTADPMGTKAEGTKQLLEYLGKHGSVADLEKFLIIFCDLDLLGAKNLALGGKAILGFLNLLKSSEHLFPPRESPFLEFRRAVVATCKAHGALGVFRGFGGDDFTILAGEKFDEDGLKKALVELTQAFRNRYTVLEVNKTLSKEETEFLEGNHFVLSAAHYADRIYILVDRKTLDEKEEGGWIKFLQEIHTGLDLKDSKDPESEQLFERQFETKSRGFFSASAGAVPVGKALRYLQAAMKGVKDEDGGDYWTYVEEGAETLRPKRRELFALCAMWLANDALSEAKKNGRNRAEVGIFVKKEINGEKIEAAAKKLASQKLHPEELSDKIDTLTGFFTEDAGRGELAAWVKKGGIGQVYYLMVQGYDGKPSKRAFHEIQEEIGPDSGDEVIKAVAGSARELSGIGNEETIQGMIRRGVLPFRVAPDGMVGAFRRGVETDRGPPAEVQELVEILDDLAEKLPEKFNKIPGFQKTMPPRLQLIAAQEQDLETFQKHSPQWTSLLGINDIMSLTAWIADAVKLISADDLENVLDVAQGKYGQVFTFNPDKAEVFLSLYQAAQREKGDETLLNELKGRRVPYSELTRPPAQPITDAEKGEANKRSEMREGVPMSLGTGVVTIETHDGVLDYLRDRFRKTKRALPVLVNFDAHPDLGVWWQRDFMPIVNEGNWGSRALRDGLVTYFIHVPPSESVLADKDRRVWTMQKVWWWFRPVIMEIKVEAFKPLAGKETFVTVCADAYSFRETAPKWMPRNRKEEPRTVRFHTEPDNFEAQSEPLLKFLKEYGLQADPTVYLARSLDWVDEKVRDGEKVDEPYFESLAGHLQAIMSSARSEVRDESEGARMAAQLSAGPVLKQLAVALRRIKSDVLNQLMGHSFEDLDSEINRVFIAGYARFKKEQRQLLLESEHSISNVEFFDKIKDILFRRIAFTRVRHTAKLLANVKNIEGELKAKVLSSGAELLLMDGFRTGSSDVVKKILSDRQIVNMLIQRVKNIQKELELTASVRARLRTSYPQYARAAVGGDLLMVRSGEVNVQEESFWPHESTPLNKINEMFNSAFHESLVERLRRMAHEKSRKGEKLVVLEWGAGDMSAMNGLVKELQDVDNVEFFAFGDLFYSQWANVSPEVQIIWDDHSNLTKFFSNRKIDLIFSIYGLVHLMKSENGDVKTYSEHLIDLSRSMNDGGVVIHNVIEKSDVFLNSVEPSVYSKFDIDKIPIPMADKDDAFMVLTKSPHEKLETRSDLQSLSQGDARLASAKKFKLEDFGPSRTHNAERIFQALSALREEPKVAYYPGGLDVETVLKLFPNLETVHFFNQWPFRVPFKENELVDAIGLDSKDEAGLTLLQKMINRYLLYSSSLPYIPTVFQKAVFAPQNRPQIGVEPFIRADLERVGATRIDVREINAGVHEIKFKDPSGKDKRIIYHEEKIDPSSPMKTIDPSAEKADLLFVKAFDDHFAEAFHPSAEAFHPSLVSGLKPGALFVSDFSPKTIKQFAPGLIGQNAVPLGILNLDLPETPHGKILKNKIGYLNNGLTVYRAVSARMTLENAIGDLKAKGGGLYEHSVRVQDLSRLIAEHLGLSSSEIEILSAAAILHDLGKTAVSDDILHKPGPLDPRERDRMDHHSEIGAALVPDIPHRREVEQIIRMHHSETTDLLTNIVTAVDYFDARTSKRSYGEPLPPDVVIAALRKEIPYINPKVIDALVMLSEGDASKTRSEMREDVLGYLKVSVKKRQILSNEKVNEITSWLLSPSSDKPLRMDLIQQTLDYIFEIRAFTKKPCDELLKLLSQKFRESMDIGEKQAGSLFDWMMEYGIVPRAVSPGVFRDFIKAYGKHYRAGQKPRERFFYNLPPNLDSETKLILATQNMKKMEQMFSPKFRKQESVQIARIPGTPYVLEMRYGFEKGSSGVYILLGELTGGKTQWIYRIGVDTQQTEIGEALRVVMINGILGQTDKIKHIFPQQFGVRPGLALLYAALGMAHRQGFPVLMGVKDWHIPKQKYTLDANAIAHYDRFKMSGGRGENEYARWGKVADLWDLELPKLTGTKAEGVRKFLEAFENLREVRIEKLNVFGRKEFATKVPADAAVRKKRSEVREAEAVEEKAREIAPEVKRNINRLGLDFLSQIHFSDVKLADADRVTDVATKISILVRGILALNRTDPAEAARQMTVLANALGAAAMQAVLTALPENSQIPATSEEGKIILLVTRASYQRDLGMVKIMLALNSGVVYKLGIPDNDPELAKLMMKDVMEWGGVLKTNGIDMRLGKRFEALMARDLEKQAVKTTTAVAVRQSEMGVFGKVLNVFGGRVKPVIFDYDAKINGNDAAAHSGLIRYAQKINKNNYKSLSYLDEDLKAGELLKDIPFRLDGAGNLKATNGSLEHVLAQIVQDLQAIMQTAIAA